MGFLLTVSGHQLHYSLQSSLNSIHKSKPLKFLFETGNSRATANTQDRRLPASILTGHPVGVATVSLLRTHITTFNSADVDEVLQTTVGNLPRGVSLISDHLLGQIDPATGRGKEVGQGTTDRVMGIGEPRLSVSLPMNNKRIANRPFGKQDVSVEVAADKVVAGRGCLVRKTGLVRGDSASHGWGRNRGILLIFHKILLSKGCSTQENIVI